MSDADAPPSSTTSAVDILSSAHGRRRRRERLISKRDLQAAVKYGKKEEALRAKGSVLRWKYTFAGIVYVTDATSTREITSWPEPGFGFDVPLKAITPRMRDEHRKAVARLRDKSAWTSHTVVVVDQSGSMRATDVDGGATRSDAVWLSLALTWVRDEIEAGTRTHTDAVSVVSMRDESVIVVDAQPVDWVLFNTLVTFLRESRPSHGGVYSNALAAAETCLTRNTVGSCALALLFFSDGRPSDDHEFFPMAASKEEWRAYDVSERRVMRKKREAHYAARDDEIVARVGALAARFGRRLTVGNVGFAEKKETFGTLRAMTEACAEYGCHASFHKPKLEARALHSVLSGLSSTLTLTQTELTELGGSRLREVRDVRRESRYAAEDTRPNYENWWFFDKGLHERLVWSGRGDRPEKKKSGPARAASPAVGWRRVSKFVHPRAVGVAMRTEIFGEGAERVVSKFREYDANGDFVGPWMVAKQSRFIEDEKTEDQKRFHRSFCSTQQTAAKIARVFNERLATIPGVTERTPRVAFLECCVYVLDDARLGRTGVLVEKMLRNHETGWKKWNGNNGYLEGAKTARAARETRDVFPAAPLPARPAAARVMKPRRLRPPPLAPVALGAIAEGDEDEASESDEEFLGQDVRELAKATADDFDVGVEIAPGDVPQAFSCFSHKYSGRRFLVCDLQGVLDAASSPPCFELTDPAIHYKSASGRTHVFGRTDRGEKGINAFFKTHVCSALCRALDKTWIANAPRTKPARKIKRQNMFDRDGKSFDRPICRICSKRHFAECKNQQALQRYYAESAPRRALRWEGTHGGVYSFDSDESDGDHYDW